MVGTIYGNQRVFPKSLDLCKMLLHIYRRIDGYSIIINILFSVVRCISLLSPSHKNRKNANQIVFYSSHNNKDVCRKVFIKQRTYARRRKNTMNYLLD